LEKPGGEPIPRCDAAEPRGLLGAQSGGERQPRKPRGRNAAPRREDGAPAGAGGANVGGAEEGVPDSIPVKGCLEVAWNISGLKLGLAMLHYHREFQISHLREPKDRGDCNFDSD